MTSSVNSETAHARLRRFNRLTSVAGTVCALISLALSLPNVQFALRDPKAVEDWRPMFLVWTASFLAIGWLLNFRAGIKSVPFPNNLRGNKLLLATGTVMLLLALTYPSISFRIAKALERQWPTKLSSNALMLRVKFSTDLDCAGCAKSIDSLLRKQKGLEKAEISFEKDEGSVWYDPDQTSKDAILKLLATNHFHAKEIE